MPHTALPHTALPHTALPHTALPHTLIAVAQLAADRGCTLKIMRLDNAAMYWVENCLFIGKPYAQLDDLTAFLTKLPLFDPEASAPFCGLTW